MCPTRYRTLHFFNNSNTNKDIATKFEQDILWCRQISYTIRKVRFKFRCNILVSGKIIKEMPVSVASGTPGAATIYWGAFVWPLLPWKNIMSVSLHSFLSYPERISHLFLAVLNFRLHSVWLCHISPYHLTNGTFFGKKIVENKMFLLIYSTSFACNSSQSNNNSARYYHKSA